MNLISLDIHNNSQSSMWIFAAILNSMQCIFVNVGWILSLRINYEAEDEFTDRSIPLGRLPIQGGSVLEHNSFDYSSQFMEMIYRWELMLERRNISTREIASWQQKSRMKTVKMIDATMLEYTKINDE